MRDDSVDLWALDEVHFQQQDPVAVCGFHRKPEIRSYTIIRPGTAWATSPQSVCEMASFCFVARPGDSMERPSGSSSSCSARPALFPAVAYSPSVTMRSIIAPNSICLGVINRLHNFAWTSCLPTARNSTLSNGSGSSRAGCVCTIVTSDSSMESFPPSKISLPNGQSPTISCADYAQLLTTLCLAPQANLPTRFCADSTTYGHGLGRIEWRCQGSI